MSKQFIILAKRVEREWEDETDAGILFSKVKMSD